MAQIVEKVIAVKLSKLVRDSDADEIGVAKDFEASLEAIVAEMIDDPTVIVEIVA